MKQISISTSLDYFLRGLSRDDALELILAIDLKVGEVSFTLDLLKRLAKSLESDVSLREIAEALELSPSNV